MKKKELVGKNACLSHIYERRRSTVEGHVDFVPKQALAQPTRQPRLRYLGKKRILQQPLLHAAAKEEVLRPSLPIVLKNHILTVRL
ncbi:hypothetical protein NECAME_10194 [Necator americanus]|uniref:Uncharacterized protein n=1 Tax=Necator americanus TaxID=51031 RepID=W2TA51_NECAM|nr:hypothetical protein NECAME_10194 [Necator americanus]ETN78728.1 hypothetical protein NECAME_10194 [Necator americanus]